MFDRSPPPELQVKNTCEAMSDRRMSRRRLDRISAATEDTTMDSSILKPASELARTNTTHYPNESAEYRRARQDLLSRRSSCAVISNASRNCAARCRRAAK